ncbi:MAG TPA: hypothetical protein VEY91_11225 [Candidatus Limnocylindria bacterium]|nr:hypothetical protein [Candidatus Limnocylindria bacterium]
MRRTLVLSGALLMLSAPLGIAQPRGDLTLGWSNCRVSGFGADAKTFACNTNSNAPADVHNLIGAFIAAPGVVALYGADMRVDIYQAAGITSWWQHTGPPGGSACRSGSNLSLDFTNVLGAACANEYWTSIPGGPISGHSYTWPDGPASNASLRMVVAVDNGAASAVPPGVETYLFTAQIRNGLTVGAGACGGCNVPACISFNRAEMLQSNGDDFVITESFQQGPAQTPLSNNAVAWQAVTGCDMVTPVQNKTWGSIKALYR